MNDDIRLHSDGTPVRRPVGKRLSSAFRKSALGRYLTSYGASCEKFSDRFFPSGDVSREDAERHRTRRYAAARTLSESRVLHLVERLRDAAASLSVRACGIFLLTFAAFTALIYLLKTFTIEAIPSFRGDLILSCVLAPIAIPLLLSRRSLAGMFRENRLFDYLIKQRFGIRLPPAEDGEQKQKVDGTSAFLIATIAGLCGFFVRPIFLLAFLFGTLLLYAAFQRPEAAALFVLLVFPFANVTSNPALALVFPIVVTLASYAIKLTLGKRAFSFEPLDLAVLLYAFASLTTGVFTAGGFPSFREAFLRVLLLCAYFGVKNLFVDDSACLRAAEMLLTGGMVIAILAIADVATASASSEWLYNAFYPAIGGRVVSTFTDRGALGVYLAMLLPFALAMIPSGKTKFDRFRAAALSILFIVVLIFTDARGAIVAAAVGAVLYCMLRHPKTTPLFLAVGVAVPFLLSRIFSSVSARLLPLSDVSRRELWRGCLAMLRESGLVGIGAGEGAFGTVYPRYAPAGAAYATHAHNLYLQITVEGGVLLLVLFVALLTVSLRSAASFRSVGPSRRAHALNCACASSLVASLVYGFFDYSWSDERVFLLFWIVVGLSGAIGRINRKALSRAVEHTQSDTTHASLDLYFE